MSNENVVSNRKAATVTSLCNMLVKCNIDVLYNYQIVCTEYILPIVAVSNGQ